MKVTRGGSRGVLNPAPPPLFGEPPNFKKRGKNVALVRANTPCLVLNSYPDTPPPFPKSCIRPWVTSLYFIQFYNKRKSNLIFGVSRICIEVPTQNQVQNSYQETEFYFVVLKSILMKSGLHDILLQFYIPTIEVTLDSTCKQYHRYSI